MLFLSSAAALVLEIVAGRLLAPYVGMSLYTWTAIISVVLAGLTIGHWIGGRLAERGGGARAARRRAAIAL
ncbi:MAG: fused MFS/spermidine synthase, partial [Magnetospirillum sp.]|nr:fused MFS/spermidine synthase [Magnetospirillum sp.]